MFKNRRRLATLTIAAALLSTSFLQAQERRVERDLPPAEEAAQAKKQQRKQRRKKRKELEKRIEELEAKLRQAEAALAARTKAQADDDSTLPIRGFKSTLPKASLARADSRKAAEFLRLQRDDRKQPKTLQTAVTRFTNGRGRDRVTVDLISAVHVGDRSYYATLNKLFTNYDIVLYELVAPKGVRPVMGQKRGGSGNPVSFIQDSMKSMLNLESQTELVNYQKDNFVHADMTPAQISDKMAERGQTGFTVAMDVISDMFRQMNQMEADGKSPFSGGKQPDLLSLLMSDDSDQKMKLMMAEQFVAQGSLDQGLGKTLNKMLIQDRNEAAMKVFASELKKGLSLIHI